MYSIKMYKQDLALNNLQWLMCHKTKPTKQAYLCTNFTMLKLYTDKIRSSKYKLMFFFNFKIH